jgi:hypothetical protein
VDPVSKPLLKSELTVEDKASAYNIDESSLKHQLFYKYKELEKALRRYYLPHVYFGSVREPYHSAVDIIHIRQITLEDDLCLLDTEGEIIIDKMKSVTTFYKPEPEPDSNSYQPCQLVRFIYRDNTLKESEDNVFCIGKIFTVDYEKKTCVIYLLTIIKDEYKDNFDKTIDDLSFESNEDPTNTNPTNTQFIALFKVDSEVTAVINSRNGSGGNMPTISFDLIYDTTLLFGEISKQTCAFGKNFTIRYKDYDLFNEKYDRPVTFTPLVYTIPFEDSNDKPKVLFIIPESVQTFRLEQKPLGHGADDHVEPVESKYAYITFTIVDNNSEKQLTLDKCNTITECDIAGIFDKNTSLSDTYSEESKFCILIEEVKDDKYVKRAFDDNEKLDKLYFSTKEITLTLQ